MNRIIDRFARLRQDRRKGFIVYIGAGDPDLEATRQLALAFDRLGVDVLELGVPFSDPLADGLVNQLAAQRGLESGHHPAQGAGDRRGHSPGSADSHRALHLLQPDSPTTA